MDENYLGSNEPPLVFHIDILVKYKDQDDKIKYVAVFTEITGNTEHWEVTNENDIEIIKKYRTMLDLTGKESKLK